MAIGKERYTRNVIYVGGAPATRKDYGIMYLLGDDMMYYYEYVLPKNGESRDTFMSDVMTHCVTGNGKMRISFLFASNIIHTLTQIINPVFHGMDADLEPLPKEHPEETWEEDEGNGAEEGSYDDALDDTDTVTPLGGTENVPHEAIGSVESIADTPIPFELWLFSIKKLGQNFAAANENYARLDEAQQAALQEEYRETFGF